MRHNPQPQEMYRHFKGNMYQIRCLAKHSETGEMLVVYQAMYGDFQIYARELSSFMSEVDRDKYPDAPQKYRFELLGDKEEDIEPEKGSGEKEIQKESVESEDAPGAATDADRYTVEDESYEELNIDPLVLEFLDADSYEKRLEILSMLHSRIDDDMINTMAVSVDIEIKEGEIEDRYTELKNCLLTLEKYECNRLR